VGADRQDGMKIEMDRLRARVLQSTGDPFNNRDPTQSQFEFNQTTQK